MSRGPETNRHADVPPRFALQLGHQDVKQRQPGMPTSHQGLHSGHQRLHKTAHMASDVRPRFAFSAIKVAQNIRCPTKVCTQDTKDCTKHRKYGIRCPTKVCTRREAKVVQNSGIVIGRPAKVCTKEPQVSQNSGNKMSPTSYQGLC